jgi:hypothetical protein
MTQTCEKLDLLLDEPELGEVIAGGLGEEARPSGSLRVIKVRRVDEREFVFALTPNEYRTWVEQHRQRLAQLARRELAADNLGPQESGAPQRR